MWIRSWGLKATRTPQLQGGAVNVAKGGERYGSDTSALLTVGVHVDDSSTGEVQNQLYDLHHHPTKQLPLVLGQHGLELDRCWRGGRCCRAGDAKGSGVRSEE